jgi:hypothetical protein
VKGQGATGAALPGWTVLLAADKGGEQPIVYGAGAPGLHLIIGLQPDRFVTIEADRRRIARVRTTEAGTAIFPWRMRREALVSVSYK